MSTRWPSGFTKSGAIAALVVFVLGDPAQRLGGLQQLVSGAVPVPGALAGLIHLFKRQAPGVECGAGLVAVASGDFLMDSNFRPARILKPHLCKP